MSETHWYCDSLPYEGAYLVVPGDTGPICPMCDRSYYRYTSSSYMIYYCQSLNDESESDSDSDSDSENGSRSNSESD